MHRCFLSRASSGFEEVKEQHDTVGTEEPMQEKIITYLINM